MTQEFADCGCKIKLNDIEVDKITVRLEFCDKHLNNVIDHLRKHRYFELTFKGATLVPSDLTPSFQFPK